MEVWRHEAEEISIIKMDNYQSNPFYYIATCILWYMIQVLYLLINGFKEIWCPG
jgi:hypothetical protein